MTLDIQADVSLKPFNSFGVEVKAKWFAPVSYTHLTLPTKA